MESTCNCRSMTSLLQRELEQAQLAHHEAVQSGSATDADWPEWYASYLAPKLVPILVKLACQSEQHLTVDNTPIPVARVRANWVGPDTLEPVTSRLHVG